MHANKTITLTIQVKEIIYDIQNKTHLASRSREAEGVMDYESASLMQVSDDDEASYQISRSINDAYSTIKTLLAEYLDIDDAEHDNLIEETIDNGGELTLSLKMPSNYDTASADNLSATLHQYLVNRALAEWYSITNKTDAEDFVKLSNQALVACKRALYKRLRPKRLDNPENKKPHQNATYTDI